MRRVLLATALGAALLAPASAGAVTLVSQVPNGSFTVPTIPSHDFDSPPSIGDSVGADDFTVPPGEVWTLEGVEAFGFAQQGNGTDTATVALYNNAAGAPGARFFNQAGIPVPNSCSSGSQCDVVVPVQGAPGLAPGTYWFSVQTAGAYFWRWAAYPVGDVFGAPAHWQNPGDGFDTGCTTFRPLPECDGPSVTPNGHRDFLFRLEGEVIDSNFTLGQFRSQGSKIKLDASFASPGVAVVSQAKKGAGRVLAAARKNLKKAKVNVAAPGQKALPIKLTRSARLRLARGRNLKLRVRVKFTATGGVPVSQVAKLKVVSVRPGATGLRLVD